MNPRKPAILAACAVLGGFLVWKLFAGARIYSGDFDVYRHAAANWLSGAGSPYAMLPGRAGLIFKYPPWTIPLFAPFVALPDEAARLAWALLELGCVGYLARWLVRVGRVPSQKIAIAFLMYWWIFLGHFHSGQITLPLLCLVLWASGRESPLATGLAATGLATKIFSLAALPGLGWRRLRDPRAWVWVLAIVALGELVVAAKTGFGSFIPLHREWLAASASGPAELGAEAVRGVGNHSFTALVLRFTDPLAAHPLWDPAIFVGLAAVLGFTWTRAARRLTSHEQLAGWLALSVIVHPLAWHHSFVMAIPLGVLAWNAARSRSQLFLALGGIACVGLILPQTLGVEGSRPFELIGVKSIGVILSAVALLRAKMKA